MSEAAGDLWTGSSSDCKALIASYGGGSGRTMMTATAKCSGRPLRKLHNQRTSGFCATAAPKLALYRLAHLRRRCARWFAFFAALAWVVCTLTRHTRVVMPRHAPRNTILARTGRDCGLLRLTRRPDSSDANTTAQMCLSGLRLRASADGTTRLLQILFASGGRLVKPSERLAPPSLQGRYAGKVSIAEFCKSLYKSSLTETRGGTAGVCISFLRPFLQ